MERIWRGSAPGTTPEYIARAAGAARHYLEVSRRNAGDLTLVRDAVEAWLDEGLTQSEPAAVVLHGEKANSFTLKN